MIAVTGTNVPVHCKKYYLKRIRYVERPTYATPMETACMIESLNRGIAKRTIKDEICAYFENRKTGKKTHAFTDNKSNIVYIPNERLQNLTIYAMYNGGLKNMSEQDLQYIWKFIK